MKQITIALFVSVLGILFLTGCHKSDSNQVRRARLLVDENIQLKKDIKEKDLKIEELKAQIEALEVENAKVIEQSGEASIKTLRMLLDTENRAKAVIAENEKLKEELKQLKAE